MAKNVLKQNKNCIHAFEESLDPILCILTTEPTLLYDGNALKIVKKQSIRVLQTLLIEGPRTLEFIECLARYRLIEIFLALIRMNHLTEDISMDMVLLIIELLYKSFPMTSVLVDEFRLIGGYDVLLDRLLLLKDGGESRILEKRKLLFALCKLLLVGSSQEESNDDYSVQKPRNIDCLRLLLSGFAHMACEENALQTAIFNVVEAVLLLLSKRRRENCIGGSSAANALFAQFNDLSLHGRKRILGMLERIVALRMLLPEELHSFCGLLQGKRPSTLILICDYITKSIANDKKAKEKFVDTGLLNILLSHVVPPDELTCAAFFSDPEELASTEELIGGTPCDMDKDQRIYNLSCIILNKILTLLDTFIADNPLIQVKLKEHPNFMAALLNLLSVPSLHSAALSVITSIARTCHVFKSKVIQSMFSVLQCGGGTSIENPKILGTWTSVLKSLEIIMSDGSPDALNSFKEYGGFTWLLSVIDGFERIKARSGECVIAEPSSEFLKTAFRVICTAIKGSPENMEYVRNDLTFQLIADAFKTCLSYCPCHEADTLIDALLGMALNGKGFPAHCDSECYRKAFKDVAVESPLSGATSPLFAPVAISVAPTVSYEKNKKKGEYEKRCHRAKGVKFGCDDVYCSKCRKSMIFVVPDVLYVLLYWGLLDMLSMDEKIRTLDKLLWIVHSSRTNVEILGNFCAQRTLLDRWGNGGCELFEKYVNDADTLTTKIVELFVSIWSYNITARDLRTLFTAVYKSSFHPALIQILNRIVSSDNRSCYLPFNRPPISYFVSPPLPPRANEPFSGLRKVISHASSSKHWPLKKFSLSFWVSYNFHDNHDLVNDNIEIFSMTSKYNKCKYGYTLSLVPADPKAGSSNLVFAVTTPVSATSAEEACSMESFLFEETKLYEEEWTHVVISYEGKPACECKLYINGILAEMIPVTRPSASAFSAPQVELRIGGGKHTSTLRLSSAYFFGDVPTPLSAMLLYSLGPSYSGDLISCVDFTLYSQCAELGSSSKPPSESTQRLLLSPESCSLESLRSSLIAVFVAPRLLIADFTLLDPNFQNVTIPGCGTANARGLKNALTDVGNLSLVLYMLGIARTKEQQQDELELLFGILRGNPEMAVQMRRLKGYQLLSKFMRKNAWIVDEDLLDIVLNMVGFRKTPETGLYDSGAIADSQAFSTLLLDWDIWGRGPEQLKVMYCRSIRASVASSASSAFNIKRMSQCEAAAEFTRILQMPQSQEVTSELAELIRVVVSKAATTSLSRKGVRAAADFLLSTYRMPKVVTYNVDAESQTRVRSRSAAATTPSDSVKRKLNFANQSPVVTPQARPLFPNPVGSPPTRLAGLGDHSNSMDPISIGNSGCIEIDEYGLDKDTESNNSLKRTFMLEMLLDVLSKTQNDAIREEVSAALPVEAIVYMLQHSDKNFDVLLLRLLFYSFQQEVVQSPQKVQRRQSTLYDINKKDEAKARKTVEVNLKCPNYCKFVKLDGFNLVGMALQESVPTTEVFSVLFEMLVGRLYPSDPKLDVNEAMKICVKKVAGLNRNPESFDDIMKSKGSADDEFRLACPEALKAILLAAASPSAAYSDQNAVVNGIHTICNMSDSVLAELLKNGLIRGLFNILRARIFKRKAYENRSSAFDPDDVLLRNVKCRNPRTALDEDETETCENEEDADEDILSVIKTIIIKTCMRKGPVSHCFEEIMVLCRSEDRFSHDATLELQNRILNDVLQFFFEDPVFCNSKKLFSAFAQLAQIVAGFMCWREIVQPPIDGLSPKISRAHSAFVESFTPLKRSSRTSSPCVSVSPGLSSPKGLQEKYLYFKRVLGGEGAVIARFLRELCSLVCDTTTSHKLGDNGKSVARQPKNLSTIINIVWHVMYHILRVCNSDSFLISSYELKECFRILLEPELSETLLKEASSSCISACILCLIKYLACPGIGESAAATMTRLKDSGVAKYAGLITVSDECSLDIPSNVLDKLEQAFGVVPQVMVYGIQEALIDDAVKWEQDVLDAANKFQVSQCDLADAYTKQEITLKRLLKSQVSYIMDVAGSLQWKTLTGPLVERNERRQRDALDTHAAWKAIFRMCTHERALFGIVLHAPFRRLKLGANRGSQNLRWKVSDPAESTLNPPYACASCTSSRYFNRNVLVDVVKCEGSPSIYRLTSSGTDSNAEVPMPETLPQLTKLAPLFQTTLDGEMCVRISGSNFAVDPELCVYIGGQRAEVVEVKSSSEIIVRSVPMREWGFYEVFVARNGFFLHEQTLSYGYLEMDEYRQYMNAKNVVLVDPTKEYEYSQPTAGIDHDTLKETTSNDFQYPVRQLVIRIDGTPFLTKNVFRAVRKVRNSMFSPAAAFVGSSSDIGDLSCVHISRNERINFTERCVWISVYAERDGEVVLTQKRISFFGPDSVRVSWNYDDICEIHTRRYVLRDVAVEIFFVTGKTCFLAFASTSARNSFLKVMYQVPLPNLYNSSGSTGNLGSGNGSNDSKIDGPKPDISSLNGWNLTALTNHWVSGRISNYGYLMCLNIRAGRTFNDLNQYPVFPWVLADYVSNKLDLNDPKTFRDLSKPMGAQTPEGASFFAEKYAQLSEAGETPYHYGTHYSSADGVIHYLSRLEPYATFHVIGCQNGTRFDAADRLFSDVGAAWRRSCGGTADVRELIPEFFTLPEMFENVNNFDFGVRQDSSRVHGVCLPPWAKSDPREFVRIHRAALESEYVSAHLHEWIDLIFGYKQQSKEALNVFHPYTCEGGIDWDSIKDPSERLSKQMQVNSWGQTPRKLFTKPHPPRSMATVRSINAVPSFDLKLATETSPVRVSHGEVSSVADIVLPYGTPIPVSPAYASSDKGSELHVWNNWDNTVRTISKSTGKTLAAASTVDTGDRISVCRISRSGDVFVCGTLAGVVLVWKRRSPGAYVLSSKCRPLYGHTAKVTAIGIDSVHNIVVTGSDDCTCIVWNILKLEYLCTLHHSNPILCVCSAQTSRSIYSVEKVLKNKFVMHEWALNGSIVDSLTLHLE